jgi:hypothetical protein
MRLRWMPAQAPVPARPAERLSQGAVIRASVLARLLGIRLLRLEADIAVVPAVPWPSGPGTAAGAPTTAALDTAAALLRRASRTIEGAAGDGRPADLLGRSHHMRRFANEPAHRGQR